PTPGMLPSQPPQATATLPPINTSGPMDVYQSQSGDTLNAVMNRFGISADQIISDVVLPPKDALIPIGTLLLIPKRSAAVEFSPSKRTIPDSEIVLGPATIGFDIMEYVNVQNGFLAYYTEYVMSGGTLNGAQAVERLAQENSLSPRILLAIIEYESHWVLGKPTNLAQDEYPLGYVDYRYRGLFRQLMWASGTLSDGFYRWRSGDLIELTFIDGSTMRLDPNLNAGTAAIQYYFSQTHTRTEWEQAVAPSGFPALYAKMFGPTWERSAAFEPAIPDNLTQPELSLPFVPGKVWAFTGGPHSAWEEKGALAALDFAPAADITGCVESNEWVVAPAAGVVARTATGVVILDLDGDGNEQTGWDIMFLHIRSDGKAQQGTVLQKDDHIGHASCEGGISTGTHVHIARKYNGEWMLADGPMPFNMDGWIAHKGLVKYKGTLTKDDKIVEASTSGTFETNVIRAKK
ncbi:MAG: LysM peptidoglycan-binding domain-containing protein, partial [Chloroflexi bacterium]|nr:LysM peptidoglycan-binding domain-containing protein [Chloroflexota bacterium]